jgi:hypothetical protein
MPSMSFERRFRRVRRRSARRLVTLSILAGALVLSWQGEGLRLDTGGLLIAVACVAWGIDNNLTRKLSSADPVQIALIKGLAAGTVNLALALALQSRLRCLSWRCGTWGAPGPAHISRSRHSSEPWSRWSCFMNP